MGESQRGCRVSSRRHGDMGNHQASLEHAQEACGLFATKELKVAAQARATATSFTDWANGPGRHSRRLQRLNEEASKKSRRDSAAEMRGSSLFHVLQAAQSRREAAVAEMDDAARNLIEAARELRVIDAERCDWERRKEELQRKGAGQDTVEIEVVLPDGDTPGVHRLRLTVGRHCATDEVCAMILIAAGQLVSSAARPGDCDLRLGEQSVGAAGLAECGAEDDAVLVMAIDATRIKEREARESEIRRQWPEWQSTARRCADAVKEDVAESEGALRQAEAQRATARMTARGQMAANRGRRERARDTKFSDAKFL